MATSALREYKERTGITWNELALKIGITYQALNEIINNRSPKTKVITCLRIKKITGLEPWDYLDGLDDLKKLIKEQYHLT